MTISERETVREALAGLLAAEMIGEGKPLQAVYPYLVGDFGGQSPVLVLGSAGTQRVLTTKRVQTTTLYVHAHVFVLYADGSWTEADTEALLDTIEAGVAAVVQANRTGAAWNFLTYADRSRTDAVTVGGAEYRREIIPLAMEVYS